MGIMRMLTRIIDTNGTIYNEWCDEDETILRMVFEDDWSWMQCFWQMLRAGVIQRRNKHFLGMIYDLSASDALPDGVWLVAKLEWIWEPKHWPDTMKRIVVIGDDPVIDELFEIREAIAPYTIQYFKRADTLQEAIELIHSWE